MKMAKFSATAEKLLQRESLRPELTRALRGTVAFVAPLIIFQCLGMTADACFAAIGGEMVALTDVRGAYRFRLVILLVITAVVTCATLLGTFANQHAIAAVFIMGGLALLSGLWRHLSWEYGPRLGVASALLFIIALAQPPSPMPFWHHAAFTLTGAAWGLVLQALLWPFRPQHAMRHTTAESWMAVSELFSAMRPEVDRTEQAREKSVAQRELELRATLDRTYATLSSATTRRNAGLIAHLQELNLAAARLGTRAIALSTSLEGLVSRPDFVRIAPTLDSMLLAFTNMTRSVALTTITHRPEHFAISEVRLRRCAHLVRVLTDHIGALPASDTDPEIAMSRELLRQITGHLANIEQALKETVDRGAASAGFPLRLPDLSALSLRTLASWINPAPRLDPMLVRHTLRMTVLTMISIALYKGFDIQRGYWIAFTVIVVLQPDYGSTRKRAGQRIFGTLAGGLLASTILWIKMPLPMLDVLVAATVLGFAYHQRQRYGLAVFFVTLMLVFLTETAAAVGWDFTLERLLCNLAGGGLALAGALLFWPVWERQRFPAAMASAIRGNQVYLETVASRLFAGTPHADSVQAKRAAETANSKAAASLQRMLGDPANRQSNVERAAVLTHCNVRMTRAITVLLVQINPDTRIIAPLLEQVVRKTTETLDALARAIETESTTPDEVSMRIAELDQLAGQSAEENQRLAHAQLGKIATEINAMILAMSRTEQTSPGPDSTHAQSASSLNCDV